MIRCSRFALALVAISLLLACSPPSLTKVDSSAPLKPINTPEKARELEENHSK